jgi:hypothetical protein
MGEKASTSSCGAVLRALAPFAMPNSGDSSDPRSARDKIVQVASAALGDTLSSPVDLGGTDRSIVLRCRSSNGSVVVKAYRDSPDAVVTYTNEAAGLTFGGGPELLAIDQPERVLVMADLGTAPTLADLLLGADFDAACDGLITWAVALGRLAADTADRRDEFDLIRSRFDTGEPEILGVDWLAESFEYLPEAVAAVDVKTATGFDDELASLLDNRYYAFSPGDTCPDNNLMTDRGMRLLDFEGAGFRPVFLDAAYCRVPFPTCWCVFRLPPTLATAAEEAYRAEIVRAYPDLADDARWHRGVLGATVAWALLNTTMLPEAVKKDWRRGSPSRPSPTWRQLLRHRWETLSTIAELPAIAETARRLTAATDKWGTPALPGYPAFAA